MHVVSSTDMESRIQTNLGLEGDIIVLPVEEPIPTNPDPVGAAGSLTPEGGEGTKTESGEG